MADEIYIKIACKDVYKELKSIEFDLSYINEAKKKYSANAYKIFNLKPYEANILKQICLSLGFDCAISRNSVTCKCEKTDCIIFATLMQYEKLTQKLKQQPFRLKELAEKLSKIITNGIEPLIVRENVFDWQRPYIMGILNVTPDSFSDGGKYNSVDKAYEHFETMVNEGADIIDIGGESTRPGAKPVTIEEEKTRIIPVIRKIRDINLKIPISVDTRNYETAKSAIEEGADIINDVSALDYDKKLFKYVCENNIPSVIMHSSKIPAEQNNFTNSDIVEEVYKSLDKKIKILETSGLERKNIIVDIGIGFGKSVEGNFELLRRLDEFTSLKTALLLGISRKSFLRNTFKINPLEADIPSAFYSAMLSNINIHRVHNVTLTKKLIEYKKYLN